MKIGKRTIVIGCSFAAAVLAAAPASAQVRISEYMYAASGGSGDDCVEVINTAPVSLNMAGWSIGDATAPPGTNPLTGLGVLMPQETAIVTNLSASAFRLRWGLPIAVKVLGGVPLALNQNDQINIYDPMGILADRLDYGNTTLPGTIDANTVSGNPNRPSDLGQNSIHNWSLSRPGDGYGSYAATNADVGNPGRFFPPPPIHEFNLREIDFFSPPNLPIMSLLEYFQHPLGGDSPPSSPTIAMNPAVEFDSYAAMDGNGPSTQSYTAVGPINLAPVPIFNGGVFQGTFIRGGGAVSGDSPSGNPGVLIARLSVLPGTALDGPLATITLQDAQGTRSIEVMLDGGTLRGGGAEYQLRSFFEGDEPVLAAARGGGAEYVSVIDIWVQRVCPGDADGNQMVNFADVLTVLSNFGEIGPAMTGSTPGDVNGDGVVGFFDVLEVLASFGSSCL